MLIQDLTVQLNRYNIQKIEEHAFRTIITTKKNELLVVERKNEKFTLEIVDNASNAWHTKDELEFASEYDLLFTLHEHLYASCPKKNAKKYVLVKMSDSSRAIYDCIKLAESKYISVEEFSQLTGMGTATVHRALEELRDSGFLERNSKRGGTTTYHKIKE